MLSEIPKTAWIIGVLGILYLVVRAWAARAEQRRRDARDERMAKLFAERERDAPPTSLAAVVSDSERVKVRCRACKALNDENAQTCLACGKEL